MWSIGWILSNKTEDKIIDSIQSLVLPFAGQVPPYPAYGTTTPYPVYPTGGYAPPPIPQGYNPYGQYSYPGQVPPAPYPTGQYPGYPQAGYPQQPQYRWGQQTSTSRLSKVQHHINHKGFNSALS